MLFYVFHKDLNENTEWATNKNAEKKNEEKITNRVICFPKAKNIKQNEVMFFVLRVKDL